MPTIIGSTTLNTRDTIERSKREIRDKIQWFLKFAEIITRADEFVESATMNPAFEESAMFENMIDLMFKDEAGQSVQLGNYFGSKPVILVLAYFRCPMLCTQVLNGLVQALLDIPFDIGKEFNVVTVSFDPREGPELAAAKKQSYLDRYGRAGAEAGSVRSPRTAA